MIMAGMPFTRIVEQCEFRVPGAETSLHTFTRAELFAEACTSLARLHSSTLTPHGYVHVLDPLYQTPKATSWGRPTFGCSLNGLSIETLENPPWWHTSAQLLQLPGRHPPLSHTEPHQCSTYPKPGKTVFFPANFPGDNECYNYSISPLTCLPRRSDLSFAQLLLIIVLHPSYFTT